MRFKLNPNSTEKTLKPRVLVNVDGELPRIDSRYETKPYKYVFIAMHDPNTDDAPVGGAFNSLAKANVEDGTYEYWSAGKDVALGEVAFVARSKDGKRNFPGIAFQSRSDPSLGLSIKADFEINSSPRG